ncbi:ATP-binding protein [Rhizobium paknamense]|uniref:Adenylate kinase n=1 Tax=Rhizobium paknamense TaxID=1206817 RepID=A0ABU0I8Q3_9HYPH|nr:ATP-binding protein [Rhizobium paknamense]MDQ0454616.1 adenylate kinase [Rhizobium paknamense]
MSKTRLVIVFGVSGAGKTTACAEYVSCSRGVVHFSASALMKRHRKTAGARSINEVMQDQHLLVELVHAARSGASASLMLLDAHSLIVVAGIEFIIPADIIRDMKPDGLIFVKAEGELIFQRRVARGDAKTDLPLEIEISQDKALKAAKNYADQLSCPLLIVDGAQGIDLGEAIKELL